jgi:hypothetical protein
MIEDDDDFYIQAPPQTIEDYELRIGSLACTMNSLRWQVVPSVDRALHAEVVRDGDVMQPEIGKTYAMADDHGCFERVLALMPHGKGVSVLLQKVGQLQTRRMPLERFKRKAKAA